MKTRTKFTAARANGVTPETVRLNATRETAPLNVALNRNLEAAETALQEGSIRRGNRAAATVNSLPDRSRRADKP